MTVFREYPPNGGYGWVVVFATHLCLVVTGGVLTSLGMFLPKFMDQFEDAREARVSLVTSLCLALAMVTGPLSSQIMLNFGPRIPIMTGGFVTMCGFLLTATASGVTQLAIGIGVVAGSGFGLVLTPSFAVVSCYFTTKYVIANGITNAGAGIGSTLFPPLFDWLIELYGWRGAAVITGGICLQICWCGALIRPIMSRDEESNLLITNNQPPQRKVEPPNFMKRLADTVVGRIKTQMKFFIRHPLLVVLAFSTTCYLISFLSYQLFLPKVVKDLGYTSDKAAFILTIAGVTSTIARASHWALLTTTGMSPMLLYLLSVIIVGLSLVFFPLFKTYQLMTLSSVFFGLGSGTANALGPVAAKEVVQTQQHHILAIGWLFLFQGSGEIVAGYLGGLLGEVTGNYKLTIWAGGVSDGLAGILISILCIKLRVHKQV